MSLEMRELKHTDSPPDSELRDMDERLEYVTSDAIRTDALHFAYYEIRKQRSLLTMSDITTARQGLFTPAQEDAIEGQYFTSRFTVARYQKPQRQLQDRYQFVAGGILNRYALLTYHTYDKQKNYFVMSREGESAPQNGTLLITVMPEVGISDEHGYEPILSPAFRLVDPFTPPEQELDEVISYMLTHFDVSEIPAEEVLFEHAGAAELQ